MSFDRYKKNIEEGDTVILFLGFDNMIQFIVDKSRTHQTKYGAVKHKDLIGVRYGSKIQCSKGYAHVLHPTPELWTQNLPHRTQILYSTDISFITFLLDLKPGSVVVEAGTGSGSLSHALLRTITPGGHLHTFDFHEQRVQKADQEFKEHGYGDSVTVTQKDVLAEGFDLEGVADAVFLDLPAPWDVVQHAKKAFKKIGGRLCSFSPCIEQVQRVCEALHDQDFSEIQTYECLVRPFDVRTINMPMPDLGHQWTGVADQTSSTGSTSSDVGGGDSFHKPVIGQIVEDSSNDVARKKPTRVQHTSGSDGHAAAAVADGSAIDEQEVNQGKSDQDGEEPASKQARTDGISNADPVPRKSGSHRSCSSSYVFKSGITPNQMTGHTGYLTFATMFPG